MDLLKIVHVLKKVQYKKVMMPQNSVSVYVCYVFSIKGRTYTKEVPDNPAQSPRLKTI